MSADDRREVIRLINEWNSSRYELFALSQPNERLEFHGVMRFYFQDAGEKVSTKCVRVDSTASTEDVIKVLIEKFRPDMKSLSSAKDYAIYEVHADSQERKLSATERPLWIQLDWGKDGREGRFLLKNENAKTVQFDTTGDGLGLLRDKKRLSKREKKKQQKLNKDSVKENKANVAENLYKEVPDSNFTRSISNPEIVMARRRQQKLENKLKLIKNRDGGGTLKIYGETLKPDIPYKTLLMSNQDVASFAVKETLEKYGLPNEDPDNYCLVQVVTPSKEEREKRGAQIREYILEDNDCPLAILMKHPSTGGSIIFQIRRCTPDILDVRKQKRKAAELEKLKQLQQEQQQQIQQQQHQDQQKKFQSQPNLQQQLQQNIHQQTLNQQMINNNKTSATLQQPPIRGNTNNFQMKSNQNLYQIDGTDSTSNVNKNATTNINTNELITNVGNNSKLPFPLLVELNHEGYEIQGPRIIQIKSDFYEIGNDKYFATTHPTNYIRIDPNIPGIEKKHCALKKSLDNAQILIVPYAETYINDRLVKEPTQLFNNSTLRLGKYMLFRLENPNELGTSTTAAPTSPPQTNGLHYVSNHNQIKSSNTTTTAAVIPPNYLTLYENGQDQPQMQPSNTPKIQPRTHLPSTSSSQNQIAPSINTNVNTNKPSEGLPGLLEFPDDGEDSLLATICSNNQSTFKLAPVYTMYMMLRYRLSQKYKSELTLNEKLQSSSLLIHKMVNYMREAVDANHLDKYVLPYWLVNSSELLYFLKQDVHLSQISYDAQELLADCVRTTFNYMVNIMQQQLDCVLSSFFDPSDHIEEVNLNQVGETGLDFDLNLNETRPTLNHVIQVLNQTMNLLRGVRVNAALTIQLFSQLFHYISMWLFNKLIRDQRSGLCSRYWGDKLTRRLNKIQLWSEKQGLELAADCHLQRIMQAAFFLQASKYDLSNDLSKISSVCYGLNSLQIKCLLKNYLQAPNEPPLSSELCNQLLLIAVNTQDRLLSLDGKQIQLEEEADLQLPFLLPEDGHSSEMIKGLPTGLLDFLEHLQNAGHCWLWQNTQGPGSWKKFMTSKVGAVTTPIETVSPAPLPLANPSLTTVTAPVNGHMSNGQIAQIKTAATVSTITATTANVANEKMSQNVNNTGPAIVKFKINKKNNGLGLSIVAARGTNQMHQGIYIKSVVPGGASDDDGRLNAGDQLLAVDEVSLIGVSQERAAELMTKSGPVVCLTIAKDAASFHDLDALLNKSPLPPPTTSNHHQALMHQSMISLSSNGAQYPNFNSTMTNNNNNMAMTLPRNHQQFMTMNTTYQQQSPQENSMTLTTNNDSINNSGNNTTRTRSMSQEILKSNSEMINVGIASPQIATPLKPSLKQQQQQNGSITSPTSTHQPHFPQRCLPNEQQIRYGSERPASSHHHHNHHNLPLNHNNHQFNMMNGGVMMAGTANGHIQQQRNLPNELIPRFGSERPMSSSISHIQQQQQYHSQMNGNQRFNGHVNGGDLSPVKQQQLNLRARQASLSELDEINYNNKQLQFEQQNQQQQQQQQQQRQQQHQDAPSSIGNNVNQFDDLYGKVRNQPMTSQPHQQSKQSNQFVDERAQFGGTSTANGQVPLSSVNGHHHQNNINGQQQYKTLPSRNGNINNISLNSHLAMNGNNMNGINGGIDEHQRTKSFGQLYEQIWANNNNNNNLNPVLPQQQRSNIPSHQIMQQQYQSHTQPNQQINFAASVDDLNFKNLEIANAHFATNNSGNIHQNNNLHTNGSISTHALNENSNKVSMSTQQHLKKFDFIDTSSTPSLATTNGNNYTNKVTRSNMQQIITPHNGLSNGHNRALPSSSRQIVSSNDFVSNEPQFDSNGKRNYENQVINPAPNHNGQVKPPPPPVSAKPIIPNKPFNININGTSTQNGGFTHSNSTNSLTSNAKILMRQSSHEFLSNENEQHQIEEKKSNRDQQYQQQRDEEQFRMSLLRQRMDLLEMLESKPQRTVEEENKLNKLRTEIEFDRRVIEMNSANAANTNNYLDETCEDNDMEYSPEVRERLTNQMRDDLIERRRLFEQQQTESEKQTEDAYAQKLERRFAQLEKEREEQKFRQNMHILKKDAEIEQSVMKQRELKEQARLEMEEYKKRREDENSIDRLMEMRREEIRLKKHIDLNLKNSNSNSNLNGYHHQQQQQAMDGSNNEINLVESLSSSNLNGRPQKHVQFMSDAEMIMSPTSKANANNLRFGSNGNSPEHSNSNGSTPPPPPPPLPQMASITTTPQKRVMFSDLEFERPNLNNGHGGGGIDGNGDVPKTPSVIGANEVYVDQRLKMKQKQQEQQQLANMFIEGEKLSFKDKMKLFAKQSGEFINETDSKFKVSKKQREIESKFDSK